MCTSHCTEDVEGTVVERQACPNLLSAENLSGKCIEATSSAVVPTKNHCSCPSGFITMFLCVSLCILPATCLFSSLSPSQFEVCHVQMIAVPKLLANPRRTCYSTMSCRLLPSVYSSIFVSMRSQVFPEPSRPSHLTQPLQLEVSVGPLSHNTSIT